MPVDFFAASYCIKRAASPVGGLGAFEAGTGGGVMVMATSLPKEIRRCSDLACFDDQGAGDDVVQAALAVRESDHDETDAQDDGRDELGEETPCRMQKRQPVTPVGHDPESEDHL